MKVNFLVCILVLTLSACGGGGGGGGGGGSKGSAATGVRILHGAVDVAPLDILTSVKVGEVVTSAYFAESSLFGELPQGEQVLSLTLHNTPADIHGTVNLNVEKNGHYSVLHYGNELQLGLRTALIDDNPGEIPDGKAAVKVVHALVGASGLNASFSDGQSANGIDFGTASPYVYLPAGITTVSIKRASDSLGVGAVSATLSAGQAYTVFMSGEIEYFIAARILED